MESLSPRQYALDILCLSRRMLKCAQNKSWQEFSLLETERHSAIGSLFSHPHMPLALHDLAELLNEVIQLDSESICLAEMAQRQTGGELIEISKGRRAVHAYTRYSH